MNIIVNINGEDVVLTLREAKILYHKLNEALHGKELNR